MKTYFTCLYKKYNHALILLYYFVIQKWFSYLEATVRPKYYMFSWLDPYIPFIKEFVIPYLLWFVYIAVVMIYLGLNSKYDFLKLCLFMFSGMSICFIIYGLFPNGQKLRPEISGNDMFSNLVRMVYKSDTPTNSSPSIHVVNSIAVYLAVLKYKWPKNNMLIKTASFITMLLIVLSTVLIKQHSILDVLYGIMLSFVLYLVIYRIDYRFLLSYKKPKIEV